MTQRRATGVAIGLVALLLGSLVMLLRHARPEGGPDHALGVPAPVPPAVEAPRPAPKDPPPGDLLLRDYATAGTTLEQDLVLVARAMDSFLLLVKPAQRGPLADNEDWAAAWQGHRASREAFISAGHRILKNGRLVDRWDSPLFFHALGGQRFEVRSAGPDRSLWTDDDIQRNPDGTLHRGASLDSALPAGR